MFDLSCNQNYNDKMKSIFSIILLTLTFFTSTKATAQSEKIFFEKADTFFQSHVENGLVDYKKVVREPESLNELLSLAETIKVSTKTPKVYQAFWINMYNLSVIKGIVANYPINSPLDKAGFFDKKTYSIAGKKITLNDIENKLLRAQFNNDPRFHFVLVCAGLGCPPIIGEAYTPEKLETQLNRQTKLALNNNAFIKVNAKKKRVGISQIFEWYTGDFTSGNKSLIQFINTYREEKIPEKYKTSYYPYNWKLNSIK